jgi:protein-S-isoprenylcysteine O-methyltransferase Ste14
MDRLELWGAPLAWLWCFVIAGAIALPPLVRGALRWGRGVRHERRFWIQRAPQIALGLDLMLVMLAFESIELVLGTGEPSFGKAAFEAARPALPLLSLAIVAPPVLAGIVAWAGFAIALFGLVFLVWGWHALGAAFSPDAELFEGQELRTTGPFRWVMHPVYCGFVFFLTGSSILTLSPAGILFTFAVVLPLLRRRARYEEALLEEQFGAAYRRFVEERRGRRLIPTFLTLPVGS